jgi:nitrite reductase (NO-forming)
MTSRRFATFLIIVLALGTGTWVLTGATHSRTIDAVNFGVTPRATTPVYDPVVTPASTAGIKDFTIPITHGRVTIADGTTYEGWMFGGTIPGPILHVRQGDLVRIHVVNESPMPHSIDFHAARIPMNEAFGMILPGQTHSFEFTAHDPGVFMVHCGTAPVSAHIMNGMYFAIIVDPAGGWGTRADKEFVVIQSEFYARPDSAAKRDSLGVPMQMDLQAGSDKRPTYVVFNGRAFQYKEHPLQVDEGDRVRFYVVNAGPNFDSDFHIVGTIFDRVYPDGHPDHALEGVQTWGIPAGGGAVFETTFKKGESGAGVYAFVTHSFADAEKGAVGLIRVGNPQVAMAGMGH